MMSRFRVNSRTVEHSRWFTCHLRSLVSDCHGEPDVSNVLILRNNFHLSTVLGYGIYIIKNFISYARHKTIVAICARCHWLNAATTSTPSYRTQSNFGIWSAKCTYTLGGKTTIFVGFLLISTEAKDAIVSVVIGSTISSITVITSLFLLRRSPLLSKHSRVDLKRRIEPSQS